MRTDIHPQYQDVLFHDTNADAYFIIVSTMQSKQTKEYQCKVYHYVTLFYCYVTVGVRVCEFVGVVRLVSWFFLC